MKFDKLEFNPAVNPGVLDTGTWDVAGAQRTIGATSDGDLDRLASGQSTAAIAAYPGSVAEAQGARYELVGLADGQDVLIGCGQGARIGDVAPLAERTTAGGERLAFYATTSATLDNYCRTIAPAKGPRALAQTPRLGIGTRMTTACWPGIFAAMRKANFAANTIQNSVRELNLMSDLLAGRPAAKNYACGFGTIETGYTGSSFEGLLVAGVLAALKSETPVEYGADADHIQVKRDEGGMDRARRLLDAARYYSFYTMDLSDILDYGAMSASPVEAEDFLAREIGDEKRAILAYHREPQQVGGVVYKLDDAAIGRLVGKHWRSLAALDTLNSHLETLKNGVPYDFELTIDEHPPEIAAFDCLTTDEELVFLMREARRRGLPVSHVAPNFGVEKGLDYRCPGGLEDFERRIRSQFAIAEEFGVLLDFHSGDDLSSAPSRSIQRATGGRHHFKISPMMQILYADVLEEHEPALFREWWDDAIAYATREAEAGSDFAEECLRELENSSNPSPSRKHKVFHWYSFAFVGKRDAGGQFIHRDRFYTLPQSFYDAYTTKITDYLCGLAEELF